MHKCMPTNYPLIFVLINCKSLVIMRKIQKNFDPKIRLVSLISTSIKELSRHLCILYTDLIAGLNGPFLIAKLRPAVGMKIICASSS